MKNSSLYFFEQKAQTIYKDFYERVIVINRGVSCFIKGLGTGAIVGMAVATGLNMICKGNKCAKRKIGGAVKSVSEFMDNLSYMLK